MLTDAMVRGLEVLEGGFGLPALRTRERGIAFGVAARLVTANLATYTIFGEDQRCLEITDAGRDALAQHRAEAR